MPQLYCRIQRSAVYFLIVGRIHLQLILEDVLCLSISLYIFFREILYENYYCI